ncbi:SET domain-containing protein [Viridothelium virens]|uniref:SET domain-containing protein n=1 Tax=Viridothelium virens TaxID=1048519 RepID=A0A6A6H2E5_VIRVR|nr:SET domain-containing protein [Viridothelium virens]
MKFDGKLKRRFLRRLFRKPLWALESRLAGTSTFEHHSTAIPRPVEVRTDTASNHVMSRSSEGSDGSSFTETVRASLNKSAANQAIDLYVLRDIHGKGKGLFASEFISCGTRIVAERPLLVVEGLCPSEYAVEKAFQKLSASSQQAFLDLESCHNSDPRAWPDGSSPDPNGAAAQLERSIYTTYQTNCVDISKNHQSASAIFETVSRINHSCVPNCHFTWNSILQMLTVHAVRDIAEGEELCVAYCELAQTKSHRAETLSRYGFVCDCSACRDEGNADGSGDWHETSDDRRHRISEDFTFFAHYDRLPPSRKQIAKHIAIGKVQGLCQLLEKENIINTDLSQA